MKTQAIIILYNGEEAGENACKLLMQVIAEEVGIDNNTNPSIITLNPEDIAKDIVTTIVAEKSKRVSADDNAVENALVFVSDLFPTGISTENAIIHTLTTEGADHILWCNAIGILTNKHVSKTLLAKHSVSAITLTNIRKCYKSCVEAGKIGE